jgi:hypothetical protein
MLAPAFSTKSINSISYRLDRVRALERIKVYFFFLNVVVVGRGDMLKSRWEDIEYGESIDQRLLLHFSFGSLLLKQQRVCYRVITAHSISWTSVSRYLIDLYVATAGVHGPLIKELGNRGPSKQKEIKRLYWSPGSAFLIRPIDRMTCTHSW